MKKRWLLVGLLFTASVVNYLDRAALGVAAPMVSAELHLSASQMGLIFSSFFFGYTIFCFVGGWSSDRLGGTKVIGIAMTAWSVFCGMTALVTGYASFLVYRLLFGAGEGPLISSINKVVANWFPHRERATAIGISFSGTPVGGALAGPIVGFTMIRYGWRSAFIVVALLGLIWLGVWLLVAVETPRQDKRVSPDELQEIEADAPALSAPDGTGLGAYMRQPHVLATAIAYFSYNYVLFFFLTWFPSYLAKAHHLSLADMSIATTLPWAMGFIGQAMSGVVSDFVLRRTGRPLFARKLVLGIGLTTSGICVALAGMVGTAAAGVTLMAVAVLFLYLTGSCYWAILQDTVHGSRIGGVGGFIHMIANTSGIIGPAATGFLIDATHSFTASFLLAGAVTLVGVALVLVFVRSEPVPNRPT